METEQATGEEENIKQTDTTDTVETENKSFSLRNRPSFVSSAKSIAKFKSLLSKKN